MSRFLCHSITDALLQPLEILVEESLLLQNHASGGRDKYAQGIVR
jgi:hypothetical protein